MSTHHQGKAARLPDKGWGARVVIKSGTKVGDRITVTTRKGYSWTTTISEVGVGGDKGLVAITQGDPRFRAAPSRVEVSPPCDNCGKDVGRRRAMDNAGPDWPYLLPLPQAAGAGAQFRQREGLMKQRWPLGVAEVTAALVTGEVKSAFDLAG